MNLHIQMELVLRITRNVTSQLKAIPIKNVNQEQRSAMIILMQKYVIQKKIVFLLNLGVNVLQSKVMMTIAKRKPMENVLQKKEKLPLLVNMRNVVMLRKMIKIKIIHKNVKSHINNVLNIHIKQNAIVLLKYMEKSVITQNQNVKQYIWMIMIIVLGIVKMVTVRKKILENYLQIHIVIKMKEKIIYIVD